MYFPKSKIETNLFSSGELVLQSTGQPYFGPYFKTFEGNSYTGKEPNDGPNDKLIPFQESLNGVTTNDLNFDNLSSTPADLRFTPKNATYSIITSQPPLVNTPFPISFTPQPTEEDYQTGEITRVFAKKRNENIYYEVENNRLSSNPMYFIFKMQWVISGQENQVKTTNQKMVELFMRQFPIPAFNKFLKNDYLRFWKPS